MSHRLAGLAGQALVLKPGRIAWPAANGHISRVESKWQVTDVALCDMCTANKHLNAKQKAAHHTAQSLSGSWPPDAHPDFPRPEKLH